MKPLGIRLSAFKSEEITYLDRKTILLDRMLLNLFELLRFDGRPVTKKLKKVIDIGTLVSLMGNDPERFPGFRDHPRVAEAWLSSDLLEIMNRGKTGQETVVGPRPFHLNAFKLTNQKAVRDYGAAMQVWAMLFHADRALLTRLKEFFGRGLDHARDKYDLTTPLDLETLAVLGLVDQVEVYPSTTAQPDPIRPLCNRQGRVLADDLRKLLAYEDIVPRHVLAGYVRTIIGLHLSLFMLRLFRIVPDWVARSGRSERCRDCPVDQGENLDGSECPYNFEIVVDMANDPGSPTAGLARASAASHLQELSTYVRSVVLLNRVKDFAASQAALGKREPVRSVDDMLEVLRDPPDNMGGFFEARINDILSSGADEEEDPIVTSVLKLRDLSPFEKYVEMVCVQRFKYERMHVIKLLDSLMQKNKPGGFLRQTAGSRAPRWFVIGNHLLETLVQIAVVHQDSGRLQSQSLLVDDFMEWIRARYGFVIYAPNHRSVAMEEQEAWRHNERKFRERLRQIGFFTDLSDAYNSQTLRPRYKVAVDE